MNKSKKIISLLVSVTTIAYMSATSFASVIYNGPIASITKSAVDSNTYTTLASPAKTVKSDSCDLKVNALYQANGKDSSYQVVRAKFYVGSVICTTETEYKSAPLGKHLFPRLKPLYQAKGTKISFKAMGNDPALDCQLSGTFSAN